VKGDTTRIDVTTLRLQWLSHSTMAEICTYWTISRDQLIRLRDVCKLPKRHDRRFRKKGQRRRDPSPREIEQACKEIRARWTRAQERERHWHKPQPYVTPEYRVTDDLAERWHTLGDDE